MAGTGPEVRVQGPIFPAQPFNPGGNGQNTSLAVRLRLLPGLCCSLGELTPLGRRFLRRRCSSRALGATERRIWLRAATHWMLLYTWVEGDRKSIHSLNAGG